MDILSGLFEKSYPGIIDKLINCAGALEFEFLWLELGVNGASSWEQDLNSYFVEMIPRRLEVIVAKKLNAAYHAGARNTIGLNQSALTRQGLPTQLRLFKEPENATTLGEVPEMYKLQSVNKQE